jgi:tetratricopeptide (TPR) repeat protein
VAEVPEGVIIRACLVATLVATGAGGREVLAESEKILALAPESFYGLDGAARAYDALGDKERAAATWLKLAQADSADFALSSRVVTALLRGGNAAHAKPLVLRISDERPNDLELLWLRWQVMIATQTWAEAVATGTRLLVEDKGAMVDSTFVLRLAGAHRANGDTVKAVAMAADGVVRFPKDARMYLLYTDLVQADSRFAVERGLQRFPEVAELHLLRAQELRRAGRQADAVAPLQRAMALDPTLGQGYLALAQTQVDLGMLDSAFLSTRKALDAGEDSATIARFALARGNAIFRAANGTKQRSDYQLALRFLALADSLQGTAQSRFLLGATALSISQSAATDAPGTKDCGLSRLAHDMLPLAREKITAGAQVAVDAARQYLDYLDQLEPVVAQQVATLCSPGAQ